MQVNFNLCLCSYTFIYKNVSNLDKLQNKLVKYMLGLSPLCRTTPLLKTLEKNRISHDVDKNNLNMFHNIMKTHSGASTFYINVET